MAKENDTKIDGQLTLFDIFGNAGDFGRKYSVSDIDKAMEKLRKAKRAVQKHEYEEKRRKENEERKRRLQEEQKQKENHVREVTCMDLPMDWNNIFNFDIRTQGVHTDSIPDALIMSLSTLGRVDIEYISSITGADYKTVICTLKGSIYQDPEVWQECFYKGWETAEEYLSGNLMHKWKAANEANKEYNGYFADNIKAIEKVLPPAVAAEDIYITLGSPWVPSDIIDDFIIHLLGDPFNNFYSEQERIKAAEMSKTIHDELTGTWEIPYKSRYNHSVGVRQTYGTNKLEALHILEKTLNMKTVSVTEEISCPTNASGKKRVINRSETVAAIEKQQKLIKEFQNWAWTDDARAERLKAIFENNFNCVRRRSFDGSFLDFPDMSPEIKCILIRRTQQQGSSLLRTLFSLMTLAPEKHI